jgi:hypothetical protein
MPSVIGTDLPRLAAAGPHVTVAGSGRPLVLRGVNRSGLEYAEPVPPALPGSGAADEGADRFLAAASLTRDDMHAIVEGWGARIVRLPFTQDVALRGRNGWPAEAYLRALDRAIGWAAERGAYTLLDLQWLDADVPRGVGQDGSINRVPALPDARSIDLWSMLAARYRDEPAVLFDLFNEPHDPLLQDIEPLVGVRPDGRLARLPSRKVGMEEWQPWARRLVEAVREQHPRALVFVSGVAWAFDLRGFPLRDQSGEPMPGLVYSTHVYPWSRTRLFTRARSAREWTRAFGHLAGHVPLFAGEWGGAPRHAAWGRRLLEYLEGRGIGWAAWSWADWPRLVADCRRCDYTPTALGEVVRTALRAGRT